MRLALLLSAVILAVVAQQKAKVETSVDANLNAGVQKTPQKEKQSGATLTGSAKAGQKGDIAGTFPGLTVAKGAGKNPGAASVSHTGTGQVGAKTDKGVEFVGKQNPKVEGKANSVTYGADKLPSGAPAFGTADLDKTKGLGHGSFNGKKGERLSQLDFAKGGDKQSTVNVKGGAKSGQAKGVGADGKDKFTFDSSNKDGYVVDPGASSVNQGTINSKTVKNAKGDGQYKYALTNGGAVTKGKDVASSAQLADAAPTAGRSALDWTCTGSNLGTSVCRNAKGEEVGKAQKDDQGNVVIYDKKGNVVGRSDVEKGKGAKEYNVNVGQKAVAKTEKASASAQYLASVKNWQKQDCYKDVAKKENTKYKDAIKLQAPYKFIYNQASKGVYKYPDCFKIVGNVFVSKDLDVKRLAVEFRARINPVGDLKCADPGACGRECYYCDLCTADNIRWKAASNTDQSKSCTRSGKGDWLEMSATVCPPPDTNTPVCSGFERSFSSDYWTSTKQDTLQVTLLFWQRPAAQTDLEYNFFYRLKAEGDSFRSSIKTQATLQGTLAGKGASGDLSDFELKEAYIRNQLVAINQTYKEELVYCDRSTTDYDMAGAKVGAKYLAGAADVLQKNGTVASSVYTKPVCKDVAALQAEDVANLKKKWEAAGSPKGSNGNPLSALSGLLGGGSKPSSSLFGGL